MLPSKRRPPQEPGRYNRGLRKHLWFTASLVTALPLIAALCVTIWRAPYPISETVALLEGAGVMESGTSHALLQNPTVVSFFDPTSRSWYRPFYHLTWYSLWNATHSLRDTLWWFKVIEVGAIAAIACLLLWGLRPGNGIEYGAALLALAVLVGSPAFRENLEVPLLYTLVGMPLLLVAWLILERPSQFWHGPVVLLLLVLAVGFKEQGLIIVPVVVAAWLLGAPGATAATAAWVTLPGMAYLAFRLANSGHWGAFEQDFSFGFTTWSAQDASTRVGGVRMLMHLYNGASTVLNLLFSEPTAGRFSITEAITAGRAAPWQLNHLVSSTALTGLLGWWGLGAVRRQVGLRWDVEARAFGLTVVAVLASAALSFNYTRDRLGGMAIVLMAISTFFAARAAVSRMPSHGTRRLALGACLLLLGVTWHIRAIGTVDAEHWRATRAQREWMTNLQKRRVEFADKPTYLAILAQMVRQGVAPDAAPETPYDPGFAPILGER